MYSQNVESFRDRLALNGYLYRQWFNMLRHVRHALSKHINSALITAINLKGKVENLFFKSLMKVSACWGVV